MLTDDEKAQADTLKLTYTEMTVALRTRIAPETYAKHKAEMQAERDAWDARVAGVGEAMLGRAANWPKGRGARPFPEETPGEDGD